MIETKEWLSKNCKANDIITHTNFLGGSYSIPDNLLYKFIKYYAEDMKNGIHLNFVEQRPNIYKFMIDLDIKDNEFWPENKIFRISKFICKVVNQFYNNNLNVIVCTCAEPKIQNNNIHTGIHLIFPKLFVDDDLAKYLRSVILLAISNKKDDFFTMYDWEKFYDPQVYDSSGFGMVGSSKDNKRIYMPVAIFDSKGSLKKDYLETLLSNYVDLICETSIRYIPEGISAGMYDMKIPKWALKCKYNLLPKNNGCAKIHTENVTDNNIIRAIIETIRKGFDDYKNVRFRSIRKYPDNNFLIIPYSKYCMNIGTCHNSCGIYFYGSRKGICQKCLCPCQNKGLDIPCSEYMSEWVPFEPDVYEVLYGSTNMFRSLDSKKNDNKDSKKNAYKRVGTYKFGMASDKYLVENMKKSCGILISELNKN